MMRLGDLPFGLGGASAIEVEASRFLDLRWVKNVLANILLRWGWYLSE